MTFENIPVSAIWQPSGPQPETGHLLIVLHGRGDSAEGFTWLQSALQLPGLSLLLLNAPDDYYTGYSWYDLPPHQGPGIFRSRGLLEGVMREVHALGFPPEKCFLFGFSQGCLMTLEFGGRYPHRLAGCIGISGYCFDPRKLLEEASSAAKSADWLITHGTHDDVLEVERTRTQMNELIQGGFNLKYLEYPKTHTIDDQVEFPLIRDWIRQRMQDHGN